MKNKNIKNYLLILLYGLFLTIILLGVTKIYGSSGDWLAQHTTIPEHFRNLFYETGKFIPNFLLSLGGGQNIFNFSYYGLCSPFILITYLFPKIDMGSLIMIISLLNYLASGMLIYKFFTYNNYHEKLSLFLSLVFLSLSPLTYHFHYHIMFVLYFPFLILALLGVDLYLKKHQSYLLMFSLFLLILTNYYYGATAIIVTGIYAIYKILEITTSFKSFFKELIAIIFRMIIPIILSAFILLPTAYALINTKRIDTRSINYLNLFIFKLKEVFYSPYSMGISFLFILAMISNILVNKKSKEKLFLNVVLTLITFVPAFMYILNGFLYIRGKVLIPFILLYLIVLGDFLSNLSAGKVEFSKLKRVIFPLVITIIIMNITNYLTVIFLLDIFLTICSLKLFKKKKNISVLYASCLLILVLTSIICNLNSSLVTKTAWQEKKLSDQEIYYLLDKIKDKDLYRTDIIEPDNYNVNRFWGKDIHSTSIYSSTYNSAYDNFYNFESANNITYRNAFIKAGSLNPIFYNQMGVKYLITKNKPLSNYKKIASTDNYNLYYNKDARPLIFLTEKAGSEQEYQNLDFPYNLEYQMNYPLTKSDKKRKYQSKIEELSLNIKEEYNLFFNNDKKVTYNLETPIKNKLLLIKFDMNYKQSCSKGDLSITINGVKNKLTCKEWYYYNHNTTFEYVIQSQEDLNKLDILVTAGKYNISNIHIYTMDNIFPNQQSTSNLQYSKTNSSFIATATAAKPSYVITSFPYDKGFSVLIDGKKVKSEIVNTAFLGFKVPKGKHIIQIKYTSPYYNLGKKVSLIGLILLTITIVVELIKKTKQNKNTKAI